MPPFERHVFVCLNQREPGHPRGCCAEKNSRQIREQLKTRIKQLGIAGRIRINESGCLDQCGNGPMMVVYPEGVWYAHVKPEDCKEIIESHLVGAEPVKRCFYDGRGKVV